jgi:hypothetical protein
MVFKIAHQVASTACSGVLRRPFGDPHPSSKMVHRGIGCTPRIARKRGELTTRNTVSRPSAVARRTRLVWGRRERQTDGNTAGDHEDFQEPHCLPERPQPGIRLHLMRDPVNPAPRTTTAEPAGLSRSGTSPDRHQVFVEAGSGRHRCRLMTGMSMA